MTIGGEDLFFDIHSHILPCVDDGSKSLEESLELLSLMKNQGITHVLATPHFYPQEDNLNDFTEKISLAYVELEKAVEGKDLPKIYLGCEMLYFAGIGHSESLRELCLNGSEFLLLELTDFDIKPQLFEDLELMQKNFGITPIIAHIERYCKAKKYRKLLNFLKQNKIPAHINASSVFFPFFKRTIKKLIKNGDIYTVASDCHSVSERPPLVAQALNFIKNEYGVQYSLKLIENSNILLKKIVRSGDR